MVDLKALRGRRVVATDGFAGVLNDLFFDTAKWQARYLAVDTGLRMAHERLLVPTASASFAENGTISVDLKRRQFGPGPGARGAARLFSGRESARYGIEASDGLAGELDELLIDADWRVAELVVATWAWLLPGSRVGLDPRQVQGVDRARRRLQVRLTRDEIRALPRVR